MSQSLSDGSESVGADYMGSKFMSAAPSPRIHRQFHPLSAPNGLLHRPITVGVVGYGYWGSKHVRVLAGLSGVELTVIESRPDRLRAAMTSFPAAHVASSLDEVCDDLDALVVATPPQSHGPIAL